MQDCSMLNFRDRRPEISWGFAFVLSCAMFLAGTACGAAETGAQSQSHIQVQLQAGALPQYDEGHSQLDLARKYYDRRLYRSALDAIEIGLKGQSARVTDDERVELSILRGTIERTARRYTAAIQAYNEAVVTGRAIAASNKNQARDKKYIERNRERMGNALAFTAICLCRLGSRDEARKVFVESRDLLESIAINVNSAANSDMCSMVDAAIDEIDGKHAVDVTYKDGLLVGLDNIEIRDHFIFYADVPMERVRHYADIAEAHYDYVDRELLPVKGEFPTGVFLFKTKEASRKFLNDKFNFHTNVLGVYISGRNAIVSFDGVGDGVFVHEITHKLLGHLQHLEFWAEEGIPASFETFYAWLDRQPTDRKGPVYGDKPRYGFIDLPRKPIEFRVMTPHTLPKLSTIVARSSHAHAYYQKVQRLVGCYLMDKGVLQTYLRLTAANDLRGYESFVEAALDKNFNEIDNDFRAWIKRVLTPGSVAYDAVKALPPSEIFEDRKDWQKFLETNKEILGKTKI